MSQEGLEIRVPGVKASRSERMELDASIDVRNSCPRRFDVAEEIEYKYAIARQGQRPPLIINARIRWLDGEAAEALRKNQAAVLRTILAEIAANRRKHVEDSQEQR